MKFYLALFASKTLSFIYKILGNEKDDKPGLLAYRLCDNFLDKISKPEIVVGVTGTNGKTTVSNLIAEILIKQNKKVIYNDWGANTKSGMARCLIDGVNIFNKPKKNVVAVLEIDEVTSNETLPQVNPNYLIVTNLFRDSMHRNAHSSFVYERLYEGLSKDTVLILNADDILSSQLGQKVKKAVYYGIEKMPSDDKVKENIINDFKICPNCLSKLEYDYRRYHHIGKVHCSNCSFKSNNADYNGKVDFFKNTLTINKKEKYDLLNDSIFNAYNLLAVITCLKEMGYKYEQISSSLQNQKIVNSRFSSLKVKNIEIETIATKGLNAVATSRVFDHVSSLDGNIEIILVVDDIFDAKNGSEAIAWIYDADFEFLNKDNIKKIIVGGVRSRDYKLRLLLAGIPKEKIVICQNEYDTVNNLEYNNIDKILILHEVYFITGAMKLKEMVKEEIERSNI